MRIRDFTIDRFGILHDQRVSNLPPGVTIFLGDNEAGKSTCLNFFRAMLFGYARNRRSIDYLADNKAVSGGSLVMESESLGLVTLRRTPGPHGGPFTLTGLDGQPRPQDELARLLRGCTPELYDKVFAFSLDELMRFSSMKEDKVRHVLHGAAFGMGMRSPNRVLRELDDAMRRLFAPRATTAQIPQLLDKLDEVNRAIREGGNEVARYAEIARDIDETSLKLTAARGERATLEGERRIHERRIALYRRWEELREADTILAATPEVAGTFSPDGRERLDRLVERLEEREGTLLAAKNALDRAEREVAALVFSPALADETSSLLSLLERKENIRESASTLLSLIREKASLKREFSRLCGFLGSGWDEVRIHDCDLSLSAHETCTRLGQELTATSLAYARAEEEEARTRRDQDAAQQAHAETQAALAAVGLETFGNDDVPVDESTAETLQRLILRARDAHGRIHTLATALRNAEQALEQSITAIAPGWTRQCLERLTITSAERERLLETARNVALAEAAVSRTTHERDAAATITEEARQRVAAMEASIQRDTASAGLGGLPAALAPEKRRLRLRRAQHARKIIESAGQTYSTANEQLGDIASLRTDAEKKGTPAGIPLLFSGVIAMVCGGGAAYIALQNGQAMLRYGGVGGFMLGLALAVAGIALLTAGRGAAFTAMEHNWTAIEQRLIRARLAARKSMDDAEAMLLQLAKDDPELFPDGAFDAEILADIEQRILKQMETMTLLARDRKECEREHVALASHERRLSLLQERLRAEETAREEANKAWEEELAALSLPSKAYPHDARVLLETVDTALARRAAWENRLADSRDAEETLGNCLSFARSIPLLADRLASIPEPGHHMAPDPGSWLDEADAFLAQWRSAGRERTRLGQVMSERATRLKETASLLASAEQSLSHTRSRAHAAEAAWQAWLERNNLPIALAPETARMALETAAKAKTCMEQRARLDERIALLREDMQHFTENLAAKASLAPHLPGGADAAALATFLATGVKQETEPDLGLIAKTLVFLDEVSALARQAHQSRSRSEDRERELPPLRDAVSVAQEQATSTRTAIEEMLRLAICQTPEAFHAAHALWVQRESALTVRDTRRAAFTRESSDMELCPEQAAATFAALNRETLAFANAQHDDAFTAILEREHALAERKGSLDAAMAGLVNEEGLLVLLRQREALLGAIEELTREWSRLSLARELLLTAKRRFESERQTGVVHHAGELFAAITDGAYSGITISLDDEDVRAIRHDGSVKDPETELSRGTREQLYLALRLAYIRDHGMQAERLPVIMDDILVNFDATRAANTAKAIAAFAHDFQVLFFTCHKTTATMLAETMPGSACHVIAKGEFSPLTQ